MKVIFLDVDGVLNSDEYFNSIKDQKINTIENQIDINKVKLLKQAVNTTGAKLVLSSSWRYTKNANNLKALLLNYGMIVDSTPFLNNERGKEIKKWLDEHKNVEDYVILDDEIFKSYDEELLKKLVKISNRKWKKFWRRITGKRC